MFAAHHPHEHNKEKDMNKKGKGRIRPQLEADEIVNTLIKMRINGASTYTLHEWLRDECDLSHATRGTYMTRMRKEIAEIHDREIENILADSISKLEELFEKSNDKRLRLDIIKELNRIRGLRNERVDITSNGNTIGEEIKVIIVNDKEDN